MKGIITGKWPDIKSLAKASENEILKQEQKIKTWLTLKLKDESFELVSNLWTSL